MSGGRTEDLTDGWPQILQISNVETDQGYGTAAQGRRQTPPPPALRCWIYKSTETNSILDSSGNIHVLGSAQGVNHKNLRLCINKCK